MIKLEQVSKVYASEAGNLIALKETDLHIQKGEFVAIMGPSGSGKSTMLQILGGLDLPSTGSVAVDGVRLDALNEKERTLFRRTRVGFVFQNYQLLPMMTVSENIALPLSANKTAKSAIDVRVRQLLQEVNLPGKESSFPSQLSGGQQQRVAIARALAMKPRLLFADEPTGNLDRANGRDILRLLTQLNREEHITIVMVTHDQEAAKAADRVITLQDGAVVHDTKRGVAVH